VRLVGPGEGTRPLGDRVKQALFAILEPTIRGRPFLDLFAGSGAAGIEALSRGASEAVFVDWDLRATAAIERNLEAAGLGGPRAEISRHSVTAWLGWESRDLRDATDTASGPFATIVVDPPYESPWFLIETIEAIAEGGPGRVLAGDGTLVAKHFWKTEPPREIGLLRSFRQERFGETMLTFYRWEDEAG
jgi:16S rRNA (guanine966-N2)-methyltransferase